MMKQNFRKHVLSKLPDQLYPKIVPDLIPRLLHVYENMHVHTHSLAITIDIRNNVINQNMHLHECDAIQKIK